VLEVVRRCRATLQNFVALRGRHQPEFRGLIVAGQFEIDIIPGQTEPWMVGEKRHETFAALGYPFGTPEAMALVTAHAVVQCRDLKKLAEALREYGRECSMEMQANA